jgi:plasmid stabilization system protein ParE
VSGRVEFHPLAVDEIASAVDWYERQRSGLGERFLDVAEASMNRAIRSPRIGTPVVADQQGSVSIRTMSLGGFPWTMAYEIVGESIVVLAVFHQRRLPNYWLDRSE